MPWNYTNTEFLNAVKSLKTDFLNRLRLDPEASPEDKIKHTVFKDEDLTVRIKCINFMTLFQDCIEQTNNDQTFCLPYYKLFLDCKTSKFEDSNQSQTNNTDRT
jgi:hypothetical protein